MFKYIVAPFKAYWRFCQWFGDEGDKVIAKISGKMFPSSPALFQLDGVSEQELHVYKEAFDAYNADRFVTGEKMLVNAALSKYASRLFHRIDKIHEYLHLEANEGVYERQQYVDSIPVRGALFPSIFTTEGSTHSILQRYQAIEAHLINLKRTDDIPQNDNARTIVALAKEYNLRADFSVRDRSVPSLVLHFFWHAASKSNSRDAASIVSIIGERDYGGFFYNNPKGSFNQQEIDKSFSQICVTFSRLEK